MRRSTVTCVVTAAIVVLPGLLAGQEPASQPTLRHTGVELSIGGRLHTQFNTTSVTTEAPSQVFIRRARIEIGIQVNERVSGAIQPDFGNDDVELKDAYMKLEFSPALQFLAGKAYRPFGLLEQTSSKRILPIERGLRIRGVAAADEYALTSGLGYSNRDLGVQILGGPNEAPMGLAYAAGVFRGPLHGQVGAQDSYQFAARLTARPARLWRIGAGWSSRDFVAGVGDTPELERGHALEVDLEYGAFAPGVHVLAEVSAGDVDPTQDLSFRGAQAWLAYRSEESGAIGAAFEPIVRASYVDTDVGAGLPGGTLLTPGVNIYFGPLNRIMINYDVWSGDNESGDARSFKAMFQLAF